MPKLPAFADWTPPWGSDDDDMDAEKAAKFIHGLLSDKEKLQTRVDEANTKVTEVTQERDDTKKALEAAEAKGAGPEVADLQKKLGDSETKRKAAESRTLKLEVAIDKGLTEHQAKRLVGDTKEELETDADELLESFGGKVTKDEEEEDDDGTLVRRPRRLTNPADSNRDEDTPIDIEKALALIPRSGGF